MEALLLRRKSPESVGASQGAGEMESTGKREALQSTGARAVREGGH